MEIIHPTDEEVWRFLRETTQHVFRVEYFLERLQVGRSDPERPHDAVGINNKYEWPIIKGLALQFRSTYDKIIDNYIRPSFELHRNQYHHRIWNHSCAFSPSDAMELGAVDTICSLLENRLYQGGVHTFSQIDDKIEGMNCNRKLYAREMFTEMKKIEHPNVEEIISLRMFPNIGVSKHTYDVVRKQVDGCLKMLRGRGYEAGYF